MTYRFNILEKEDILDSIIQPLTLFIWFGIHNLKKKRNHWLRKPHKIIIFCQFTLLEIYYIKHPRPQTMEMDEPVNKCQLGNNEDQWMLLSLKFLKISWSCLNALSEVNWPVAQYQEQHAQGHLSFTKSFTSTSLLYYAMKHKYSPIITKILYF